MTHEEAKEIVKRIKGYMGDGECWSESEFMAMDMAIQALSQEPCDDAISRETVLGLMQMKMGAKELYIAVHDLHSITQKSGKWIRSLIYENTYNCSKCGSAGYDTFKYCPNCGAKMESEDKE